MKIRVLLWALLIVSSGLTVALARQNRSLRNLTRRLAQDAVYPRAGLAVPTLKVATISGDSIILGATEVGSRQVLLAFNTTCPFCRASLPAWTRLVGAANASPTKTRVYGISLDSADLTKRFVQEHGLVFPIVLMSGNWPEIYRLGAVPSIVVVDSSGRTEYARVGALTDALAVDSVMQVVLQRGGRASPDVAVGK